MEDGILFPAGGRRTRNRARGGGWGGGGGGASRRDGPPACGNSLHGRFNVNSFRPRGRSFRSLGIGKIPRVRNSKLRTLFLSPTESEGRALLTGPGGANSRGERQVAPRVGDRRPGNARENLSFMSRHGVEILAVSRPRRPLFSAGGHLRADMVTAGPDRWWAGRPGGGSPSTAGPFPQHGDLPPVRRDGELSSRGSRDGRSVGVRRQRVHSKDRTNRQSSLSIHGAGGGWAVLVVRFGGLEAPSPATGRPGSRRQVGEDRKPAMPPRAFPASKKVAAKVKSPWPQCWAGPCPRKRKGDDLDGSSQTRGFFC